jgi:ferritin-like metal-binding protein YciE
MPTPREHFLSWLEDAHAVEEQAESMLSAMAPRLDAYPNLQARIREHIRETQRQNASLRDCLARHGTSPSPLKDLSTRFMGFTQSIGTMFTTDEVMKGVLASYALEHLEIGTYKMLVKTARQLGDDETARVCEKILEEELAMAKWLEDHIEEITQSFLRREER